MRYFVFIFAILCAVFIEFHLNVSDVLGNDLTSDFIVSVGDLNLKKAYQIAIDKNPSIRQAYSRIKKAKVLLLRSKGKLLPSLSFSGSYDFIDSSVQPSTQPHLRVKDAYREYGGGLMLNWLIFDGFQREAAILVAKSEHNISLSDAENIKRLLFKAIGYVFYIAQLSIEDMVIAEQDKLFNKRLESDALRKFNVGVISESEMLNFSLKVLRAESNFQEAQRRFKIALTMLAELLGFDNADLPQELYPERAVLDVSDFNVEYDNEIAVALENRADLKSIKSKIKGLKYQKKIAQAKFYPKINFRANADYIHDESIDVADRNNRERTIGIVANWDIFSGGVRHAEVKAAQAQIEEAEEAERELILSICSNVRQTIENMKVLASEYVRRIEEKELTEKIRGHVEKSYKAGVSSLTRLNEVQNDLVRASGNLVSVRINYLIEKMYLLVQTGKIEYILTP